MKRIKNSRFCKKVDSVELVFAKGIDVEAIYRHNPNNIFIV